MLSEYMFSMTHTLRKKCPYSEFFWSVFSSIKTKYRDIRSFIKKEIPPQVFFWEYWWIFKNTYFEEHLPTAASAVTNSENPA